MRLTCPNCGTDYEVPDGMVPASGRHVQCTECHTRWFVRGGLARALSEDQILDRLETLTTRPRPVAVPDPISPEPAPASGLTESQAEGPVEVPAPRPLPGHGDLATTGDRPRVAHRAPLPETTTQAPRTRLELGAEPPAATEAPAPPRNRFASGFLLALVLCGLALAAYIYHAPLAARYPQTAGALEAYGAWVDGVREDVQALRERVLPES